MTNTKDDDKIIISIDEALHKLTDEQRLEIFHKFCMHCGADDPKCKCARDE